MKKLQTLVLNVLVIASIWGCCRQPAPENFPSDKLASTESKALMKKLSTLRSSGTMFGQEDALAYGIGWKAESDNFICDVSLVSGKYPAVFGWDLGQMGCEYNIDSVSFAKMTAWIKEAHRRGGINVFSWHYRNPVSGGSPWELTPAIKEILPGGDQHQQFIDELNNIINFFSTLYDEKNEPIPVIFRPFHEFENNWFWWSHLYTSREQYIQLWQFMVNYLRANGLHNILYCYNPGFEIEGVAENYYPGDNYVDLVGIDTYSLENKEQLLSVEQRLQHLDKFCKTHHKIPCLSEAGYNTIPKDNWWTGNLLPLIKNKGLSYVLVWRNARTDHYFAPYPGQNSAPDFINFLNNPAVLTLDKLKKKE